MTDRLRIALAQLNPTLGDLPGNAALLREARIRASREQADLVLASELSLCGYPPEDLVLKPAFLHDVREMALALAADTADDGPDVLVGLPWQQGAVTHNALAHLSGGKIEALRFKHILPNYGVFDEMRVFKPGPIAQPIVVNGVRIGVPICEDIWQPETVAALKGAGAELLLVPNGSPFEQDKAKERLEVARARTRETGLPLAYVNQVGGQDELLFDGGSFVLNADGKVAAQLPCFESALAITEWQCTKAGWICEAQRAPRALEEFEAIYLAMMLGLGDYVRKNRFPGALLGLSGGVDSALVAAIAADALGPELVRCVKLPSRFTAPESIADADAVAHALGCRLEEIAIEPATEMFSALLRPAFLGRAPDVTEENIQARARGLLLMALSNKFGELLITTGNKSELAVGYATLYGDMCGGFNPIKDLYKTQVYALARWRNQHVPKGARGPSGRVIPEHVLTRAPTAELRPNQRDEDTLPPYKVLDEILQCLIEKEMPVAEIAARGFDAALVTKIEAMLYAAEYKRRQAPPGVKLTRKSFGRERRYPITNRYRDGK